MTSLEIVNRYIDSCEETLKSIKRKAIFGIYDGFGALINSKRLENLNQIKKDLVLLEVLKEQSKHSKFYSESAIQEINRKFDKMEGE